MADEAARREWTKEQSRAIRTVDRSLLVSAAAGSGKTTVLAERCAQLVCDPQSPCDVDDLLVVTFTEAAAAQMKARIGQTLRGRAEKHPGEELSRQLALIDHAQVSTLHGFCARLLRQHFHLAKIDPAFRILDGEEAALMRNEVARKLLRESYSGPDSRAFEQFIDAYGEGDDERLLKPVVSTYEMLASLSDPNKWVRDTRKQIREAASGPLAGTEMGKSLNAWIARGLTTLKSRSDATLTQLRQMCFAPYERYVAENLAPIIDHWNEIFESDGIDALSETVDVQFPRLPSLPATLANKDLAKAALESLRTSMKEGSWRGALRFTTAQWQQGMAATLPHAMTFLNLIGQFVVRYRADKEAIGALDFSDLERLSLKVLGTNGKPSPTALAYHQRFRHVLVDEYQDINELQDTILSLVSHQWAKDRQTNPNQFYVGDVKQSIYRFRLAEPELFMKRDKDFRGGNAGGEVIDLQANFRSRGPLVDAINGVFQRLMITEAADINYDQSHRLVAKATFPDAAPGSFTGSPIELHILPMDVAEDRSEQSDDATDPDRTEREAHFVAHRIRQLMGMAEGSNRVLVADDKSLRPVRLSDIVILLRSMRYKAEQFAEILGDAGIPVHADSVTGYFESMEVRDILALLRVLDNRQQDIPLAAILRSPLGRLPNPDDAMARIRLAYPATDRGDVPFHQAVARYAVERTDELAAHLRDFDADLQRWREAAQRRPLDELLWDIYQESGYLAFCEGLPNGSQRAANLMLMQEKARQFGTFARQGLSRFLEFLESLQEEADIGLPSTVSGIQDVVRILSIHRSKGLEFPIVVLPDLGKKINMQDCQGAILTDRKLGLGLSAVDEARRVRYPSLASALLKDRLRQQAKAEELRVLYVAMTRAREHLIMLGTAGEGAVEKWMARWSNHAGPLPAEEILGAASMLQWIGPVAAAAHGSFAVLQHTADEIAKFSADAGGAAKATPRLSRLAALEPSKTAVPRTETAQDVIDRLEAVYPFAAFTALPAVASVTGHTESAETEIRPSVHSARLEKALERPRFLVGQVALSATERGTATHLVLQHLDFRRACNAADIAGQIAMLIERRSMSRSEADAVDHDAIAWFVASPLGQLLQQNADRVRREIPVYFALDGPGVDPADRKMIRGRLDLLLPLDDGHLIVDYKTDAVDAQSARLRAEQYRGQMEHYRHAIERITRQTVKTIHLVFLTPRCVVTI